MDPIVSAPLATQIHVATALLALVLGPAAIWRRKRDGLHRALGYVWVTAMAATAISSFWITGLALIGPFGPIHVLSVIVLVSLTTGVRAAIRRDVTRHQRIMQSLYWRGLAIAGLFTLLPGRIMSDTLFGQRTDLALAVVVLGGLAFAGHAVWPRLQRARDSQSDQVSP